jgi:uncharacterized protein (TIGR03118 family)
MQRRTMFAVALGIALLTPVSPASAWTPHDEKAHGERAHHEGGKDDSLYAVTNLVADNASFGAKFVDKNLVNSWGIAATSKSFRWVADNGTGLATLYDGDGNPQSLVVAVAGVGGAPAAPTGVVANEGTRFVISDGQSSGPALFIFASEDGTISGWNAGVPPPSPATKTVVKVDESAAGAVFKGLAISPDRDRLFAANFFAGAVEVFDGDWNPVKTKGGFVDPKLPKGFAPFGIRVIGNHVFVTYALQDSAKHDDVAGAGNGFIDEYTLAGELVRRVASRGKLNSPWGLALAPDGFGSFSGHLLVGNFGDGHLMAFDFDACRRDDGDDDDRGDFLEDANGPVVIDGLWGLDFGNGNKAGPASTLYFAAGPNDEADSLFGRIDLAAGRAP